MDPQLIKDRRWNSFHGIVFQQSSQFQRSASDPDGIVSAHNEDPSNSYPDLTTHSSFSQSSSKTATEASRLNLRPTGKLSYSESSLSSCGAPRDDIFYSLPSSSRITPCNETAQAENTESLSSTENSNKDKKSALNEPFRSPRGFHIPCDKLQDALDARPGSEASFWQYTLYQGPEGENDRVKLHYCKNKEATEAVSQLFIDEEVIGFDIEWSAQAKSSDGIKKNVALIQIACEDRIALFHIARFPGEASPDDLVAPTLKRIMESPKITKVGVAIKADCTRLKNFLGIHCQGLFELSYLHKLVSYCSGNIEKVDRRNVRLAEQVQEHLKLPLLKGEVQTSDWGRDLDYQQTQYAASDSYAGLQLFHVLEVKRQSFDPVPPRPAHAELNLAISLGDQLRPREPIEGLDDGDESSNSESVSSSDISMEELAREYFHVSLDDSVQVKPKSGSLSAKNNCKVPSTSRTSTACTNEELPTKVISSPELELANQFVSTFSLPPNRRVAPQALRAYSLWHEQGLSIPEIASILRQPPIQGRTVITYLCDAISNGNLSFEPSKLMRFQSEFSYQPYIKAHKDLFERARREASKAESIEARRIANAEGPTRG